MTDGSDDRNDPERRDPNADWWQGAPAPGSPWESHPQQPVQPPPGPPGGPPGHSPGPGAADPTRQQPFIPPPGPGPAPQWSGAQPQVGPNPVQTGQNPQVGQNPYPTGSNPQIGAHPYRSGANPVPGPNPYATGGNPYQPAQPAYGYVPPPPPGNGRVWLYAGIGTLVVVLVAVAAIVLVNRNSGTEALPTTTPPTSTTTSRTSSAPRTTTTTVATPAPLIPGYQVVVPTAANAAWDVPQDWTFNPETSNFTGGGDTVPVAGLALEGTDYCTDNVRTQMFLSVTQLQDTSAAAVDIGSRMAKIGWSTNTSITPGSPEPFDSTDHNLHGVFVETTGAFTSPDPKCAKTFSVYTFAVGGGATGALVLTIGADTGVDRAVTRDFARTLLATFRLL